MEGWHGVRQKGKQKGGRPRPAGVGVGVSGSMVYALDAQQMREAASPRLCLASAD